MRVTDMDSATISDTIERLVYGKGHIRTYAAGRVEYNLDAREAYSYGSHFPLFRFVPRKYRARRDGGRWLTVDRKRPPLFVINGDVWRGNNSRTNAHQAATRARIARTGIESIILPFSALSGAGINIDSVVPLHVRPDSRWNETIERRTLAELPRWRRTYSEPVPRESRNLADVPRDMRTVWRDLTADERASGNYPYAHGGYAIAPRLPDPDGIYRWNDSVTLATQPDADGIYRFEQSMHRLGDSLFTATRDERSTRPALPFETERDTARETITFRDADGRSYCPGETNGPHVAGPDAACIHCASGLLATVVYRRRARYLSSFDTNEPGGLYFLCEVSRRGAPTVEGALDSLAPRAVHSAILDGREVRRQGDVFFIDTPLTTETLAARGAVFGRFTLWDRGAKPKPGEVTYRAPNRERDERTAKRELKYARQLWRDSFERVTSDAITGHVPDRARREHNRGHWRALLARQATERAAATAAGERFDGPLSMPCERCGATIGESCRTVPGATAGTVLECRASYSGARADITRRHATELSNLRHDNRARYRYAGPSGRAG